MRERERATTLPSPERVITVVTGPLRSGTSCVTGLLERCGFDLGGNVRILRKLTEHNPRGHFEPDLLFTINDRLLFEVPGDDFDMFHVPDEPALRKLADKRDRYFQMFIRRFDGQVFKDPLLCLTLPFWEERWPEIQRTIFCLRHPMAVARSMEKRCRLPLDQSLDLWTTYATRFFSVERSATFVFDFDAFTKEPHGALARLLRWLERPMTSDAVAMCLENFFEATHVHWSDVDCASGVPSNILDIYEGIRTLAS